MARIVTLTVNPAIDVSTEVDSVVPERKLRCRAPRREPGGGGINVSRAIHRLGGSSRVLWTCAGETGALLEALLVREGLDQEAMTVPGLTRENVIVFETSTTLQYRFGMPGPDIDAAAAARIRETVLEEARDADYLVMSGSLSPGLPTGFYAELVRELGPRPVRLVLDTSGEALREAVAVGGLHLIKPNRRELESLMGRALEDEPAQEQAARELVRSGAAERVLISMGAGGVLMAAEGQCLRMRSPTVPIRSKVGAGDSMVAGVVLASGRDWSLLEAVRYGVAAGAAAVMTPGSELCRREDTDRLYEQMLEGIFEA